MFYVFWVQQVDLQQMWFGSRMPRKPLFVYVVLEFSRCSGRENNYFVYGQIFWMTIIYVLYVLGKKTKFATDLEDSDAFIGLEISSRTPCFAVGGMTNPKHRIHIKLSVSSKQISPFVLNALGRDWKNSSERYTERHIRKTAFKCQQHQHKHGDTRLLTPATCPVLTSRRPV